MLEISAFTFSAIALVASILTLYLQHLRRFGVACVPEGIFVMPPMEGREDDTRFAITVAMALRNTGVQAGVIDGAYVSMVGPGGVEFRLTAIAVAGLAQPLVEARGDEAPTMIEGLGGFVPLDSRETRAVSIRFAFPSATAKDGVAAGWQLYGRPVDRFVSGDYQVDVWLRWGSDRWTRYSAGKHELSAERMRKLPIALIMGDVYDRAPGGPAAGRG